MLVSGLGGMVLGVEQEVAEFVLVCFNDHAVAVGVGGLEGAFYVDLAQFLRH